MPRLTGVCLLLFVASCAGTPEQPSPREPQSIATLPETPAPAQPPSVPEKAADEAGRSAESAGSTARISPPAHATTPPVIASPPPATPEVSAAPAPIKPLAKTERQAAPVAALKKSPAAAAEAPQSSAPTLDLKSLETRLKETTAIGVMTKLTLKGQVDDLLDRFRAYHAGKARMQLSELRQPYDSLILKVLALLQDKDPSLASAIASSREAIWAILSDRAKFSQL